MENLAVHSLLRLLLPILTTPPVLFPSKTGRMYVLNLGVQWWNRLFIPRPTATTSPGTAPGSWRGYWSATRRWKCSTWRTTGSRTTARSPWQRRSPPTTPTWPSESRNARCRDACHGINCHAIITADTVSQRSFSLMRSTPQHEPDQVSHATLAAPGNIISGPFHPFLSRSGK